MNRRGLSLLEVLLGALIIGVSALSILELIRSGTQVLEVTEAEAAARQLAADVLRRLCGPRLGKDLGLTDTFKTMMGGHPQLWSDIVEKDPPLKEGFPVDALKGLLNAADARLELAVTDDDTYGKGRVQKVVVTVHFVDRNERNKKVTFARLIEN